MKRLLIINRACVLTAVGSLSLAYLLAGYWQILLAFSAMSVFWILLKRWSVFRTSSALLSMFVLLTAIGVTLNLSILLILIACTAALAGWDLANFTESGVGNQRSEAELRLERTHLRSLAMAIFAGLSVAFISSSMNFQIPFWVTIFLVLIAIGCLTYGMQSLVKNR
jgi:hypothetical protein